MKKQNETYYINKLYEKVLSFLNLTDSYFFVDFKFFSFRTIKLNFNTDYVKQDIEFSSNSTFNISINKKKNENEDEYQIMEDSKKESLYLLDKMNIEYYSLEQKTTFNECLSTKNQLVNYILIGESDSYKKSDIFSNYVDDKLKNTFSFQYFLILHSIASIYIEEENITDPEKIKEIMAYILNSKKISKYINQTQGYKTIDSKDIINIINIINVIILE